MARTLTLAAALWLGACLVAGCGARTAAAPGDPAPPALDAAVFDSLAFSFTDPETLAHYEIAGPYRVLRASRDVIELEGVDPGFHTATYLTLFMRGDALWARALIDGREFLTRVN